HGGGNRQDSVRYIYYPVYYFAVVRPPWALAVIRHYRRRPKACCRFLRWRTNRQQAMTKVLSLMWRAVALVVDDRLQRTFDDGQTFVDVGVGADQRRHHLEHVVSQAGGFHDQTAIEAFRAECIAPAGLGTIDTDEQPAAAYFSIETGLRVQHAGQLFAHVVAFADGVFFQRIILPELLEHGRAAHESMMVAANRAGMFAGLPDVQLRADQGHRQRHAHAGQRFGHGDHVG